MDNIWTTDSVRDIVSRKLASDYNESKKTHEALIVKLYEDALKEYDDETELFLVFPDFRSFADIKPSYALHRLCRLANPRADLIQKVIDLGGNINAQNPDGDTPLHILVERGRYAISFDAHLNAIEVLLKNGADKYIRNKIGLTPLELSFVTRQFEAAEAFMTEEDKLPNIHLVDKKAKCNHMVKCLLRERLDWNFGLSNYSLLLHFLIFQRDEKLFEFVVENSKYNVNAANGAGRTLLHVVAQYGTRRMIIDLINAGADPDAFGQCTKTPLILAVTYDRLEIVKCLLDCGASVDMTEKYEIETNTALHYATALENFEAVKVLVEKGANVNALTYHRSPLLLACGCIYNDKWELRDTNLKIAFYKGQYFDQSSIPYHRYSSKIVNFLLDHGADIQAKNSTDRTPLDQACRAGDLEIVELLLSRGAQIDQGNVATLHYAVKGENPSVVKLILKQGGKVNARCGPEKRLHYDPDYVVPYAKTPFERALIYSHWKPHYEEIVNVLLKHGADVNLAIPLTMETPLHIMTLTNRDFYFKLKCTRSYASIIRNLLKRNPCNINAIDKNGITPLAHCFLNHVETSNDAVKNERYYNRFKPDLEIFIYYIVQMIAKGQWVSPMNLIVLKNEYVLPIYEKLQEEANSMKEKICESRNFTYLDILSKGIDILGRALKNDELVQFLDSKELRRRFPTFAEEMEERISHAMQRQQLVELGVKLFEKHVKKGVLLEILIVIFKHLNMEDLQGFAKACFLNV